MGAAAAEALVLRLYGTQLAESTPEAAQKDPKTQLQEWLQGRGHPLPQYEVEAVLGEDHAQAFVVRCEVAAPPGTFHGEGGRAGAQSRQRRPKPSRPFEESAHERNALRNPRPRGPA